MKINTALLATLFVIPYQPFVLAQGTLTPPGAPAPTMKTLDQIEARRPISQPGSFPILITQPGSYYLTKNLAVSSGNGIDIDSHGVSVDLRGFTISSSASPFSGTGIRVLGERQNIAIQNGHISGTVTLNGSVYSGSGFQNGVYQASGSVVRGARVSDISIVGCGNIGIYIAETNSLGATVERCSVELVGSTGIHAGNVAHCSVRQCQEGISAAIVTNSFAAESVETGITAITATDCTSTLNGGKGIVAHAISGCSATRNGTVGLEGREAFPLTGLSGTVTGSTAANNGSIGIHAQVVTGCAAIGNTTHGIWALGLAKDNLASQNGRNGLGAGIFFNSNGVRVEGNNCYENDWGVQSTPATNGFIVRNSCRGNAEPATNASPASSNYDFDRATNTYGPVITVNGDMSANAAASHPAANIQY